MKLTGEQRVRFLLGAIPYFRERQYAGNYYDNDDLNDIEDAMERADLTAKQRQAIELLHIKDLTQTDAARLMRIDRKTLREHEGKAVTAIVEAYEKGKHK